MTTHESNYRGWYTSRKLPHFDSPDALQFITFRLADSIPSDVLRALKKEAELSTYGDQSNALRAGIETYLDRGYGCCLLAHPAMAATVQQAFKHYAGARYQLLAWCIMPNHVHVLIKPAYSLPRIIQGWKTYSARWALQNAGKLQLQLPSGGFWMRGYWDRYIRDEVHLEAAVNYIQQNPVKAGLCQRADEWKWSSAGEGGQ